MSISNKWRSYRAIDCWILQGKHRRAGP